MTTQLELALMPSEAMNSDAFDRLPINFEDCPPKLPDIISLFCGAGGLDLGFHLEGFNIPLAIDKSPAAIKSYNKNFEGNKGLAYDLTELKADGVLKLVKERVPKGTKLGVIGGPPCQGFSRANTLSKSDDVRNLLPTLYLEIVEKLQKHYSVEFVVFENVLGIRDKKHLLTYQNLVFGLEKLKFDVTEKELIATDYGVPQNRRRVVLSAMRRNRGYSAVIPQKRNGLLTVRDAIFGLCDPLYFNKNVNPKDIPLHRNHWTMQPKSPRFLNPQGIQENPDGRSFKRLIWDKPSRTIAFGHREIHIHPDGHRRLSIYEAMLLQGFPKEFVLEGNLSEQVEQVSNAVPPPLAQSIAAAVKGAMVRKSHDRKR